MSTYSGHGPLTFTATDWAPRSQGGSMGRGRLISQYAVMEATAPKPSREEVDRDKEGRGGGRGSRRPHNSSVFERELKPSDNSHSRNCIAKKKGQKKKNSS